MPYREEIYESMSSPVLPTNMWEVGDVIAAVGKEPVEVIDRELGFWDPSISVEYSCYMLKDVETGKVFRVRDKCCENYYRRIGK